jgi:hypothetical protein
MAYVGFEKDAFSFSQPFQKARQALSGLVARARQPALTQEMRAAFPARLPTQLLHPPAQNSAYGTISGGIDQNLAGSASAAYARRYVSGLYAGVCGRGSRAHSDFRRKRAQTTSGGNSAASGPGAWGARDARRA